jgi:HJR/Mrr/RecB family endonuclease
LLERRLVLAATSKSHPLDPSSLIVFDLPWDDIRDYLVRHPDYLHTMHPRVFERLIAELFASRGWDVELTARTRDGGYDILGIRHNQPTSQRIPVEAKRFSPDRPVGVALVRALYGVRTVRNATQVVLATSSHVSKDAKREFVRAIPWELDLLERERIFSWCREFHPVTLLEPGV